MSLSCWFSHPFLEVLIFLLYVEGCNENVVARRTAEVSNFLDMLRSASSNGSSRASETVHSEWKVCYAHISSSLFLLFLIFWGIACMFPCNMQRFEALTSCIVVAATCSYSYISGNVKFFGS